MASTNGHPSPEEDIKHFKSIPWCLKHLQPPGTELIISSAYSRTPKHDSEDALFSETINTPSTLSHFILFYPRPSEPRSVLPEIKGLITLGNKLDGHPGICHGGIVATIFDEVLGYAAPGSRLSGEGQDEGKPVPSYVTAYLHTTYIRPVRTPGTILVTARTNKVDGRKIWVEASMEDGQGEKLAKAEALFVQVKLRLALSNVKASIESHKKSDGKCKYPIDVSMASFSFWTTKTCANSSNPAPSRPPPAASDILNLLDLVSKRDLQMFPKRQRMTTTQYKSTHPNTAGAGGYASVQVADIETDSIRTGRQVTTVALKTPRSSAKGPGENREDMIQRLLDQPALEARILSHDHLRRHPHIVNILGIAFDDGNASASMSIILEYSSLGSLSGFLRQRSVSDPISVDTKIELAACVGSGLQALHDLQICHGDVKTQNALVFVEHGRLIAKVSDFGQSIVTAQDDPSANVAKPRGTPLLSAPEIRNSGPSQNVAFSIQDAMMTDVFSFGLLVWEVLSNGDSFFQPSWMVSQPMLRETLSLEAMEDFLNQLPQNEILKYGMIFLSTIFLEPEPLNRIAEVLGACLQDDPSKRCSMPIVCGILTDLPTEAGQSEEPGLTRQTQKTVSSFATWTTRSTPTQVFKNNYRSRTTVKNSPADVRRLMIERLKTTANSAQTSNTRAHAAMILSEFNAMNFLEENEPTEVVHWLKIASEEGHDNALAWYERVCEAIQADLGAADNSSSAPNEEGYLSDRISQATIQGVLETRETLDPVDMIDSGPGAYLPCTIFNDSFTDEPHALHMAALLGDNIMVQKLIHRDGASGCSEAGFNAVHYACLGGHVSTLELVLRACNENGSRAGVQNITPFHLTIFFRRTDISTAVDLLIRSGARPVVRSDLTEFDAHNIALEGVPLDWAVLTRNRALVEALLPYTSHHVGVQFALWHFYYEIADYLLNTHLSEHGVPLQLTPPFKKFKISRPYQYWIAHGRSGPDAIRRTIKIAHDHMLLDHEHALRRAIAGAGTKDSFYILEAILSVCPSSSVKALFNQAKSALAYAITGSSDDNPAWENILKMMVNCYSIEELDQRVLQQGSMTYLHLAVAFNSLLATRVLLGKGVDVNRRTVGRYSDMTPLHICAFYHASTGMWRTLLEYGADINAEATEAYCTPVQLSLMQNGTLEPTTLTLILEHAEAGHVFGKTLRYLFDPAILIGTVAAKEQFRWALTQHSSAATHHVDSRNYRGATMLHQAAFYLRLDIIRLLLDANADASISLMTDDGFAVLPFHIACFLGYWLAVEPLGLPAVADRARAEENRQEGDKERRWNALDVVMELVNWHVARGDEGFDGITKLHLAYRMVMPDEAERLIALGFDKSARGTWPGLDGRYTPRELLQDNLLDRETEAVRACIATGMLQMDAPGQSGISI